MVTDVQHTGFAPRIDVLHAVRRHWFVAVLPVVVFVACGVTLAIKRPPHYTATANLSVGHVYVSSPSGIPTILDATQSLAAVYSRAIHSGAVMSDTQRRLGNNPSGSADFSATPLPDSPLIKVSAESSSPRGAVGLANASAAALAAYVNRQVRDDSASATLSDRYREASLSYRRRQETSKRLRRRYREHPTRVTKVARDRAAAATDTALLRREALRASYEQAVQGGTSSAGVEFFSRAAEAKSDRRSMTGILIFIGLMGGLAAGAALALLRAARDIRRYGG